MPIQTRNVCLWDRIAPQFSAALPPRRTGHQPLLAGVSARDAGRFFRREQRLRMSERHRRRVRRVVILAAAKLLALLAMVAVALFLLTSRTEAVYAAAVVGGVGLLMLGWGSLGVAVHDGNLAEAVPRRRIRTVGLRGLPEADLVEEHARRVEFWRKRLRGRGARLRIGRRMSGVPGPHQLLTWGPLMVIGFPSIAFLLTGRSVLLPLWFLMLIIFPCFVAHAAAQLAHGWRDCRQLLRSLDEHACPDCGYDLRVAVPEGEGGRSAPWRGPKRCIECGSPWPLIPPPVVPETVWTRPLFSVGKTAPADRVPRLASRRCRRDDGPGSDSYAHATSKFMGSADPER